MWKYLHNAAQIFMQERRRGFSNRSTVDAAVSGRRCVFLGESKSTLFGFLKVDAFRNHWLRFVFNSSTPNVRILQRILWTTVLWTYRVQVWLCTKSIKKRRVNPTLLWQSGASESATVSMFISSSICYWLFKCRVLRVTRRVWVCVCVWGEQGHIPAECTARQKSS